MIRGVLADDMNFNGVDSSGKKTATRSLIYQCDEGDSTMLLAESNYLPQKGDAHPEYPSWIVESVDEPMYDSSDPRFLFRVKYSWGGSSGGGADGSGNAEPWTLGPQNISFGISEKEIQIRKIWNPEKKGWIPLVNSAGNRIVKMGSMKFLKISFDLNYKHVSGKWRDGNTNISINDRKLEILNIPIKKYCGRMQPYVPVLHTVYENDGKTVKWQYETVKYEIDVISLANYTWMEQILDVGRLARFRRNGILSNPEVIFSYTPWKSKDDNENLKTLMQYGGIDEVVAAQKAYEAVVGTGGEKNSKIPYSQIDEELPLNADGTVFVEAMRNPMANPYRTIDGFEVIPENWAKYSLPERI